MKIQGFVLGLDELFFGFDLFYGGDEDGDFHGLAIGLIFFRIEFLRYL